MQLLLGLHSLARFSVPNVTFWLARRDKDFWCVCVCDSNVRIVTSRRFGLIGFNSTQIRLEDEQIFF